MREKGVKLRLVLLIMLITIVIGQVVPTMAFAEGNTVYTSAVTYEPKRQKYAIAPQALYKDANFYNQYVKTEAKWAFNSITYFTDGALNYNTEKLNYNQTFSKDFSLWDPVMGNLCGKGQIWYNLRSNLANAESSILGSKIGIQEAQTPHYSYYSLEDTSSFNTFGDMDYWNHKATSLKIAFVKTGERKNTRVKNVSLVFADADNPKISSIYATDIDGNAKTSFGKNDEYVYIHVKFDEYIRFSDSSANHADVYLKLKVAQNGGNQVTGADQRASLISLKDDTLSFRYKIPESIRDVKTDHFIYGFEGMYDANNKNVLNAGDSAYPLRVLTATGELGGHYAPGLIPYTSKSLITDLAGNPSGSTSVPNPNAAIHIDIASPAVKKVEFTAVGDKSQYIGAGG
ncbi:MAG TPA: hypothetical protein GX519_05860, partial [Thermoanaerobacterales bacterium]|nr:hypothetical protein [Thermoanaerobacterales bacterium]